MDKKPDRRIERTKNALRQSLIELVAEKEYDEISIQDITNHANLGRATFYLHYSDKDALLSETIEHTINQVISHIINVPNRKWIFLDRNALKTSFTYFNENPDLINLLMSGKAVYVIALKLNHLIYKYTLNFIQESYDYKENQEIPLEVIASYLSNSILSFVFWWQKNQEEYSVEEIIPMFQKMVLGGCGPLLNIDPSEY